MLPKQNNKLSTPGRHGLILDQSARRCLTRGSSGSSGSSSSCGATLSPTFAKESCIKTSLSSDAPHIFDSRSSFISPLLSFDDSIMNVSISSSNSWYTPAEKMQSSIGSNMGLPTEYPSHRKNTSVTLEEELEDFDLFGDAPHTKRHPLHGPPVSTDENPLKFSDSSCASIKSSSVSSSSSALKRSRHRRQRTAEIGSFDDFPSVAKVPFTDRRHQRNQALGPKDFYDQILTQVFEDVSTGEFRY